MVASAAAGVGVGVATPPPASSAARLHESLLLFPVRALVDRFRAGAGGGVVGLGVGGGDRVGAWSGRVSCWASCACGRSRRTGGDVLPASDGGGRVGRLLVVLSGMFPVGLRSSRTAPVRGAASARCRFRTRLRGGRPRIKQGEVLRV